MRKALAVLTVCVLSLLAGCAGQNSASTPAHKLRLANADLAAALNKVESTALTANQQGIISVQEAVNVSQVINNLTVASDGIEKCAELPPSGALGTITGCVEPFIASIRSQMNLNGLGIKSPGAVSTFAVVINGVLATLDGITKAEAGQ